MYEKNVRNDDITKNFIFLNNKKITVLEINMKSVLTFLDELLRIVIHVANK